MFIELCLSLSVMLKQFINAPCIKPDDIIYYPDNSMLNRKCYWFDRVRAFQKSHEQSSTVFIGDSITQAGNWKELMKNEDIANRGIGGDTAALILERMDSIYSLNASTAYVMVGINDFYRDAPVEEVYAYYDSIILKLVSHNMRVNVLSTLHCNSEMNLPVCKSANQKIIELNKLLASNPHVHFIDLNKYLSNTNELNSIYTLDGIHLNTEGYSTIGNVLLNDLNHGKE